jgi:hypothetical protein
MMKKYFRKLTGKKHKKEMQDIPLTDSFADSLSLDLKRSAIDAVNAALTKNQDKYLSSVLKQSHFPIESIVFRPMDKTTALQTEEFFRIHNEIDSQFEKTFYNSIILKEYRTEFGACAFPAENMIPSIQPSMESVDNPTNDEAYQISLRGNKKRFFAEVKLGVLKPKISQNLKPTEMAHNTVIHAPLKSPQTIAPSYNSGIRANQDGSEVTISVNVLDADGEHNHHLKTPFIIGRESTDHADSPIEKLNVQGMYVSRHQLTIFQLHGLTYAFIPKEASLTGVSGRRGILQKMHLLEIDETGITITFGQPIDSMKTSVDPASPNLYPTIKIKKASNQTSHHESTPIPKMTR